MAVRSTSPTRVKLEYPEEDSREKLYQNYFANKARTPAHVTLEEEDEEKYSREKLYNKYFTDGERRTSSENLTTDKLPRKYLGQLLPNEMIGGITRNGMNGLRENGWEMLRGRIEDGATSRRDPLRARPTKPRVEASLGFCNLAKELMASGIGPCAPSLSMKYAEILMTMDQFESAMEVLKRLPEDLRGEDLCEKKRMMGRIHTGLREYDEAHELFDEALETTDNEVTVVKIGCDATVAYIKEGRYTELGSFLELGHKSHNLSDVDSFHFFTTLAEASYHLEDYRPAQRYLQKALDVSRRLKKQDSILNVNMAQVMNKLELWVDAMPLVEKSWGELRESFGLDHPYTFKCGVVLAETYFGMDMIDEASEICEEVWRIQRLSDRPSEDFKEINMRLLEVLTQGLVKKGPKERMW